MTISSRSMRDVLARAPVMPILTIHDASIAGDLARALVEGGVFVFEVVMRTPAALDAIKAMSRATPEASIGVGTLLTRQNVEQAVDAGAVFGVSPGLTSDLGEAVRSVGLPFLPGVTSASEVMRAMEFGFFEQKLFPAHGRAGVSWLQAMSGVFPRVSFCPTGGIKPNDISEYLSLPNCMTVGGSWVAPANLVTARDWASITELARQASGMARLSQC
jgi:2-dehydro-3-deoxyphosphogluconate aldolase / (4S)-4-hydroxy-2-oxoglutarate aldolase